MKAKLQTVEEELDESIYWIRLLIDTNLVTQNRVNSLLAEGEALLSMIVASIRTLRDQ
jgi:four helix bundle protein